MIGTVKVHPVVGSFLVLQLPFLFDDMIGYMLSLFFGSFVLLLWTNRDFYKIYELVFGFCVLEIGLMSDS